MLTIKDLKANIDNKEILKGLNLEIKPGEVHAIMGPNGSGKSTLSNVLSGKKGYTVTGEVKYFNENLLELEIEERAHKGIFLAFQYPLEIPGVNTNIFLKTSLNAIKKAKGEKELDAIEFLKLVKQKAGELKFDEKILSRQLNVGFSGGERQCLAISRAIYFGAKVLVLDEPTSALGVHQASMVLKYIVKAAANGLAVILITHNVHHAYPVGNSFTVLNRGKSLGTFQKKDISREELLSMMAGGEELEKLEVELKEMDRLNN
ncbi:Fe-S cluster assembly ATPase SufC [Candidatus Pelagibacter bacterium]|nr:Fe-S cluster assembly ATPase SufC [Candidatus Pelagibacter bacterium]MDA8832467.1 Fe-S cluster assembly ATPase SufC [Candidatus Pelagibacter bacterium]